jgi:hypothetical protein
MAFDHVVRSGADRGRGVGWMPGAMRAGPGADRFGESTGETRFSGWIEMGREISVGRCEHKTIVADRVEQRVHNRFRPAIDVTNTP